jgi:hypothetical protein
MLQKLHCLMRNFQKLYFEAQIPRNFYFLNQKFQKLHFFWWKIFHNFIFCVVNTPETLFWSEIPELYFWCCRVILKFHLKLPYNLSSSKKNSKKTNFQSCNIYVSLCNQKFFVLLFSISKISNPNLKTFFLISKKTYHKFLNHTHLKSVEKNRKPTRILYVRK